MQVRIYNQGNIQEIHWRDYQDGLEMQIIFEPLIREGSQAFISNVSQEIQMLAVGEVLFPLVIGDPQAKRSAYVCSPTSQYFDLAKEEIELEMQGKGSFMAWIAPLGLNLLKGIFKQLAFDRVVFVNNFILSTNLYPAFDLATIPLMLDALVQAFPKHSLIFRSVNDSSDLPLLEALKAAKLKPIISRPLLMMHPAEEAYKKKRMYKSDQKLWKKNKEYYWEDQSAIQPEEIPRLEQLYHDLYLDKYSSLNPQYKPEFIELLVKSGLMDFYVLRDQSGTIQGVTAFFKRNGVLTTPFIGYEQSIPLKVGLYRFLNYRLMQEAIEHNLILNMSSGAAHFKKLRGGTPSLEYNMVYYQHLPRVYRLPWQIYYQISERIAIPGMQRYEL